MKKIEEAIIMCIKDIAEERGNKDLLSPTSDTLLFGNTLDSLGVVLLLADLEEAISDQFDIQISLADERAMSQKTSPFRSVKTLTKYTKMLIKEQSLTD